MTTKRTRRCSCCKTEFRPARQGQRVCSIDCAKTAAVAIRVRADARAQRERSRETKQALEKLKTIPQLIREAQIEFNKFIRLRDAGKPCICCGQHSTGPTRGGEFDAGHYRSRGAAGHLRFDERNVHAQLKHCNRYKAGNVVGYRAGLIARIGLDAVESLENDNSEHKWTRDELAQIKRTYVAKRKALEAK